MSTINTNGINVNYPVPGVNNSTQGFRDNFANIKTNLDTASTEITDLQEKVLLKQALANSTLNNDMAGTLISNATTRGFRASTYNLGNALSGTVVVDVGLGDVQYGTVAGNITLQFGGWAPINTESSVILKLTVSNANAVINFPSEVVSTVDGFGVTVLENYSTTGNISTVTTPHGVTQLDYELTTIDCGNTIAITPLTRPYQTTQFQTRVPPSTGLQGDVNGTTSVGTKVNEVIVTQASHTTATINASVVNILSGTISGTLLTVQQLDDAYMDACYISGTTLFVGSLALGSGSVQVGMELSGIGVVSGTVIQENISGTGGGSYWRVNISQTVSSPTSIYGTTPIVPGMLLSGLGILANTYIVSNDSGTGAGSTWNINQAQSIGPLSITGTTGIVGNVLYVGQLSSGSIAEGTMLSGTGIIPNTTIVSYVTGSGSGSIWTVSKEHYAAPSTISGVRDALTCNDTTQFYLDMPIVFTGNTFGNIIPGVTYYVKDIMTGIEFSITLTPGGDGTTLTLSSEIGAMGGNPINYLYVCTQDYDGVRIGPKSVLNTYSFTNYIKLNNIVSLQENSPIIFEGETFGGVVANVPYYIKSIDSGNANILISQTKYNGLAGATFEVLTANTSNANACAAYSIVGSDIWKQIPLMPVTDMDSSITAVDAYITNNLSVNGDTIIQGNLTVDGSVSYGTVTYVDIDASGNANLENIFANNITANTFTANGIAIFSNVSNLRIAGGFNGYYLQTDGDGNLNWAAAGGGGDGSPGGSVNQVQFNDGTGNFAGSTKFEFNSGSNTLSVVGDITANNITATENATTANLTINEVVTFSQVANLQFNDSSGNNGKFLQLSGSSLSWSSGTGSGTTTAAGGASTQVQYNNAGAIDGSAGLTFDNTTDALAVTGNVTAANVYANSGTIGAANLTGTLTTAAQPNIAIVGTLSSLNVSGKANVGALYANTAVTIDPTGVSGFAAGGINEPVTGFTGAGIVVGSSSGQHGAITYGGNVMTFATENNTANSMSAKAYLYSNGLFQTDFLTGTLSAAASSQPNIRSLGALNSLIVSGNINANNFIGRLSNGSSNVSIPIGSGNVVISAAGNTNVLTVSGTGANVNGGFGVTGNIVTIGTNRGFVGGYMTARNNVTGNIDVSGNVTGSLGIRANTQTYTDNSAIASQSIGLAAAHAIDIATYAAANTGVVLSNAASFTIKGAPLPGNNVTIINAYSLYADETSYIANLESNNISAGNISTAGNLDVSGTATFADVNSVKIPGGEMGYFLQTDGEGGLAWATGTVTPTGTGTAAGSNQSVQFSDGAGAFQANAGFTFNKDTGNLSIPGSFTATNLNGVITVASGYQPNIVTVGTLTGLTTIGNITTSGVFKGIFGSFAVTGGLGSGSIDSSVFTGNIGLRATPSVFNDSFATAGASIANAAVHGIGAPTFTSTNASVLLTNAASFLVKGEPVAGTNITITNKYALWVDGNSRFSNNLIVAGNLNPLSNVNISNVESFKIGSNVSVTNYYLQTDGAGNCKWALGTVNSISVPGGSDTQIQFNDSTAMAGSANLTFDKATNNLKVGVGVNIGNLVTTGKVYSGVVAYANTDGTAGQLLTTDGSGTTYWSTPPAVSVVQNGTSSVSVPVSGGNVNTSVGGTANVLVVTTTGANIAGTANITGNANVGVNAHIVSNLFVPTLNSNVIANATSIKFNIGAATKLTINATGLTTPDKVNVGGVFYTNAAATDGQVLTGYANGQTAWTTFSGIATVLSNGASNVRIATTGGNIEINPASGKNANVSGNLVATGNVNSNNINVTNDIITSNISASAYIMLSGSIVTVSGTTKTLSASDNGKILYFTSATAVTLTTATGLGQGFSVVCIQGGAGKVTASAAPSTTLASYGAAYKSAGQYAVVSIMCPVTNTFVMSGQTSTT